MSNLLCNSGKNSYDKRTKSAMASQVKHEGPANLRGAEGTHRVPEDKILFKKPKSE